MLISHKNKFIFIHIYKTAGTSVMDVFLPYCRLVDRFAYQYRPTKKIFSMINGVMGWQNDGMKQYTGFHKHEKACIAREKMGADIFDSYFKFAFIRDPFDFIVSLYFFIRQSPNHYQYKEVSSMEFNAFVPWYLDTKPPRQSDFVKDSSGKEVILDFIGRFDQLQQDVNTIQDKIGISGFRQLKHENPSVQRKSRDFKSYYDDKTELLIKNYFQEDFDLLEKCR